MKKQFILLITMFVTGCTPGIHEQLLTAKTPLKMLGLPTISLQVKVQVPKPKVDMADLKAKGFGVQFVDPTDIFHGNGFVTGNGIAVPIPPSGPANPFPLPRGTSGVDVTFTPVPVGNNRVVTVTGLDQSQNSIAGHYEIKGVTNVISPGPNNVTVSVQTTPTARVIEKLIADSHATADTVDYTTIQTLVDRLVDNNTGGNPLDDIHPSLVNHDAIAAYIEANGAAPVFGATGSRALHAFNPGTITGSISGAEEPYVLGAAARTVFPSFALVANDWGSATVTIGAQNLVGTVGSINYTINNVTPGTGYSLTVQPAYHQKQVLSGITVAPGGTTTQNVAFVAADKRHWFANAIAPSNQVKRYQNATPIDVLVVKPAVSWNVSTVAGATSTGYLDGPVATAEFNRMGDIAIDSSGNFYLTDRLNHRIRKIDTFGNVTTVAGSGVAGHQDGSAATARFNAPNGIALDTSGNIYVTDTNNHRIRKIDTVGNVTTVAGSGVAAHQDGSAATARFNAPNGIALDTSGNIYVSDRNNHRIRKIDTVGNVTTVAGDGTSGYQDGSGAAAKFFFPSDVALDTSGNIYVTDTSNHRIRKIDTVGNVSTVAGDGTTGYQDGPALTAKVAGPSGISFDSYGNLFIFSSHRMRKLDTLGNISTVAGTASPGYLDGPGPSAQLANTTTTGITVDSNGNVYIAEGMNNRIRKISPSAAIGDWNNDHLEAVRYALNQTKTLYGNALTIGTVDEVYEDDPGFGVVPMPAAGSNFDPNPANPNSPNHPANLNTRLVGKYDMYIRWVPDFCPAPQIGVARWAFSSSTTFTTLIELVTHDCSGVVLPYHVARGVVAHEMTHALGGTDHSPTVEDVMYPSVNLTQPHNLNPSINDINTMRFLFDATPTVTNTNRSP